MTRNACLLISCLIACVLPGQAERGAEKGGKQGEKPKQEYRFKPMPIPKVVVKHRRDLKVRVDGVLDEWPAVIPLVLRDPRQVSGTALGAYRGPNDISGQLYMLWDEQNLYLGLQVLDDWHRPLKKSTPLRQEIPPVDNCILSFDPNRDTRAYGDDPGRREDRHFYLAELEEIGDKLIQWDRRRGTKNLTAGGRCISDRREKEGVTIYEARIPWPEILPPGQKPQHGRVLDMQVVLNDYDEVTDPLPQTRVGWNFGIGPQVQPGLWGSIMLVTQFDPRKDRMPEFPAARPVSGRSLPRKKYWVDLYNKLSAIKPAFASVDTVDPAMVAGAERYKLLMDLEGFIQAFPRLDNIDYHFRVQRRMTRETAGISQDGLPFYWDFAKRDLLRRAVPAPPEGVIRVFRLPQGGWYVRTSVVNFTIDPCGLGLEELYVRGGVDFALLTRPREVTRRHDPMLIRMAASKPKRPFFTHLEFHLTGAKAGSMFMVKPFTDYLVGGLKRVTPIGKLRKDGKVSLSIGYLVEWQDGRTLLAAGLAITREEIEKIGLKPDILIVSGQHHEAVKIAKAVGAKHTIIDDTFIAEEYPDHFGGRLGYQKALVLQGRLKPLRSLILAPGESIDIRK